MRVFFLGEFRYEMVRPSTKMVALCESVILQALFNPGAAHQV